MSASVRPPLGNVWRSVWKRHAWLGCALAAALAAPAGAGERPAVAYVVPPVLRAGQTQAITLHGRNLQDVTGLLADVPLAATLVSREAARATFRVTVAKEAWPGIHQIRALAADSVSPPRLLLVDELPLIRQQPGNHFPAQAQRIPVPAAVIGQTERGAVDYYRIKLDAPATLTLEVVARRFGTGPAVELGGDEAGRQLTIDPVLHIRDAAGRELLFADDTPGLTSDLRVRYAFPRAGEYLVAVHDVQYQGGPEHQYVLRLGDFPDVAVCRPAGGPPNRAAVCLVPPGSGESFKAAAVAAAGERLDGVRWLWARRPAGLPSLALPYLSDRLPGASELEHPGSAGTLLVETLPGVCNGCLQTPDQVDRIALELRKGQRVRVSSRARALGSSIWPAVRVLGANGSLIAATEQEGKELPWDRVTDPRLDPPPVTFPAAADGRYVIEVERRLGRPGPAAVYRLEIEPFAGSYALRAPSDFLSVPRGGRAVFAVDVRRESYDGPVEVAAAATLPRLVAAAGVSPGPLVRYALIAVTAPADQAEAAGWFVITGRAAIGGREVEQVADLTRLYDAPDDSPSKQGYFFLLRPLPPVVTRRIPLLITEPAPFALDAPPRLPAVAGGSLTVPIRCRRRGGFDGPVALRVEGLPRQVEVGAAAVARGAERSGLRLKVPADLEPGRYPFAVVGEAAVQGRKRTSATAIVTLEVSDLRLPICWGG